MANLFTYGSLMFPEVLAIVLGRNFNNEDMIDAILQGYRRVAIPDRTYPTGIESPDSHINGKLIAGITEADLQRLDAYEEGEWDAALFEKEHLRAFVETLKNGWQAAKR